MPPFREADIKKRPFGRFFMLIFYLRTLSAAVAVPRAITAA